MNMTLMIGKVDYKTFKELRQQAISGDLAGAKKRFAEYEGRAYDG